MFVWLIFQRIKFAVTGWHDSKQKEKETEDHISATTGIRGSKVDERPGHTPSKPVSSDMPPLEGSVSQHFYYLPRRHRQVWTVQIAGLCHSNSTKGKY